ncbi:MAG TPA: radical SAM protein [Thermodesulfobacteriota bacterium]|nr:radical SAM protein [Thermodesulfobacteriota bacterium]
MTRRHFGRPSAGPAILLITASCPEIRRVRRSRVLNFQQITMPYLAAFVPGHWTVTHVDEAAGPVDVRASADLVAITFHTPSAPHAYELADEFRSRGITVALGGPHATLMPDEAQRHADVVFVGEAESHWPCFLQGFEGGEYESRYTCLEPPSLDRAPISRQDLLHRRDHTSGVLFATRGCAFRCDFCTVAVMYQSRVRRRPVLDVVREFASFRGRVVILWDDNIAADTEYAKELFRALAPQGKWWSSQASVHAAHDEDFLRMAARSGCKQLFLGLESISQGSLDGVSKRFNRVDEYANAIDRIHAHGISVQAGIVFGFDGDTERVFSDTVDFLESSGVQNATFNLLTPFPGTRLHQRLESEGRILTRDWRKYNGRADVVFRPRNMSAAALLEGYRYANERFYSPRSIYRRLSRCPAQLSWALPLNLAYALSLRRDTALKRKKHSAADTSLLTSLPRSHI